jgi:hypothetical protein
MTATSTAAVASALSCRARSVAQVPHMNRARTQPGNELTEKFAAQSPARPSDG